MTQAKRFEWIVNLGLEIFIKKVKSVHELEKHNI